METIKICVIGLGYVGLPLARLFSTKYETIGFDMNQKRVDALNGGHDATLEVSDELLQAAIKNGFKCTTQLNDIKDCNIYIVAVPTPVDENNRPDLKPLWGASETVGKVISKGDIVVYESTVYPGVTEEECLPVVERVSGLKFNVDFYAGYSPERINPGDKEHTVENGYACFGAGEFEVDLLMKPELVASSVNVVRNLGKAALRYGPVIYCAEAIDNGGEVHKLYLDPERVSDAKISYSEELGRQVIDCDGFLRVDEQTDKLYAPYSRKFEPVTVRMIPYHCFANRGESAMQVWHLVE